MASIVVSALALGCGRADAVPASAIVAPAGWRALPELAAAATTAAAGGGVTVEGAQGWGEPARGCYAAWLAVRGGRATADQILEGISGVSNVVAPAGDGVLTLAFARPPYHGRLRATLADGRIEALACFWNDREPAACDAACTSMFGSMR